jgi:hypothetical protein
MFQQMSLVAWNNNEMRMKEIASVRWYKSNHPAAHIIYCALWFYSGDGKYRFGVGNAGGYGYCKRSAAFSNAARNAGIILPFDKIAGAGMKQVIEALASLGIFLGYKENELIIV